MTNLFAHPVISLGPCGQLVEARMCVLRAHGFVAEHLLIHFSLCASFRDEYTSTKRMTSTAIYASWYSGFSALIMNKKNKESRKVTSCLEQGGGGDLG